MNIRINNIECRETIYETKQYEIIRWEPNIYYDAVGKLIEEGYEKVEYNEGYWGMKRGNHTISGSCFKSPETCYVVAWLEPNRHEPDVNLVTVGNRLLRLNKQDRDTFFRVYEIANEMIMDIMQMESL